jgi:hypothetical protein
MQHVWKRLYIILVAKPDRLECRWEDNIKMDLKELRYEDVDRIHMLQDRIQREGLYEHTKSFRVPCKTGNFFTNRVTTGSQEKLCPMELIKTQQRAKGNKSINIT